MTAKPTYGELEQRVKTLEKEADERRRAEQALLESEERFRTLADASPTTIAIVRDERLLS